LEQKSNSPSLLYLRFEDTYRNGFFFHYHISASKQYPTTELFTAANGCVKDYCSGVLSFKKKFANLHRPGYRSGYIDSLRTGWSGDWIQVEVRFSHPYREVLRLT